MSKILFIAECLTSRQWYILKNLIDSEYLFVGNPPVGKSVNPTDQVSGKMIKMADKYFNGENNGKKKHNCY